jgi:hypothetical protein
MKNHPHDAPVDKSTISGGLGLSELCFEEISDDCKKIYKGEDCVSDALVNSGNKIRVEELDVPGHLSRYEKKLLLAGYFIGRIHTIHLHQHDETMKFFSKMIGGKETSAEE